MATKTWTGAALPGVTTNNWNNPANWNLGTLPIAGDDIVFDGVFPGTGNKDCTLNVTTSFASINFTGYTGSFTFSSNLNMTGAVTLGAGTTYLTSGTVTSFSLSVSGTSSSGAVTVNLTVNGSVSTEQDLVSTIRQGLLIGQSNGNSITLEAV